MDWMTGDPDEIIAYKPRRYVRMTMHSKPPEGLEFFVGGGFTDDHGVRWKPGAKKRNIGPEAESSAEKRIDLGTYAPGMQS